jgi:uncharacterized protein (TIGR03083 family)
VTDLLDASIAALRSNHDELVALIDRISPEELSRQSGATEWTVAQVLSHLGSGSELTRARLEPAVAGEAVPEIDSQSVWDRWNAMPPEQQAAGFVAQHGAVVSLLEGLDEEQRKSLTVDLGFLPEPATVETFVGMRLNETSAHAWDVRVAFDPAAGIETSSAGLVAAHLAGGLGFVLDFAAKPQALAEPATLALDGFGISFTDTVDLTVGTPESPTATFHGPLEAAVRMLSGRLRPEVTPAGVEVTGNVSLDDLRPVFPGY